MLQDLMLTLFRDANTAIACLIDASTSDAGCDTRHDKMADVSAVRIGLGTCTGKYKFHTCVFVFPLLLVIVHTWAHIASI